MIAILPILAVILIAGFLVWLVGKAPIDETFKNIFRGVAIVALIIWLIIQFLPYLHQFGIH